MTAYVDTSVVMRYLSGDDPGRMAAASVIIETTEPRLISIITVLEAAHALRWEYRYQRQPIARSLIDLITRANISVPEVPKETVRSCLQLWHDGGADSIGDALIAASMLINQADRVFSFDRRFPRLGWEVLTAPPPN